MSYRTNRDIRDEAWAFLWERGVFSRLLGVETLVFLVAVAFAGVFVALFGVEQSTNGWVGLLRFFLETVLSGIFSFGFCRIFLKIVRNEPASFVQETFSGMTRPLDFFWLQLRMGVQIFLWSLLLIVPGLIAFYRYRLAWFLKADHPDWSAGECLAESGRLMQGCKGRLFYLDCSYWAMVLLLCVAYLILLSSVVLSAWWIVFLVLPVLIALSAIFGFYWSLGSAIFYRDRIASADSSDEMA